MQHRHIGKAETDYYSAFRVENEMKFTLQCRYLRARNLQAGWHAMALGAISEL